MNLFIDQHQKLLSHLLQHEVDFIIIGGYSVIYHGYHRTTGDVDVWLKPTNLNKAKLIKALRDLDIDDASLKAVQLLDFEKQVAFYLWEEPEKVEFLTYISGVMYAEADRDKIVTEIDHLNIPFLHLDHLILSKMSTGRLQDLADIEELQKVRRFKK